jgi:hypothetical protein
LFTAGLFAVSIARAGSPAPITANAPATDAGHTSQGAAIAEKKPETKTVAAKKKAKAQKKAKKHARGKRRHKVG